MPLSEKNTYKIKLTDNRKGCPYGLCVDFNYILAVNYHISTTIQRRQQATALPRRCLFRIVRNSLWLSDKGSLVKGAVVFRRKMTEGEITKICCLLLSLPQFRFAQQLLPSCGVPILFMRLGAPHKIDRCANRCSLYPPQAAFAYVARQREPVFYQN